MPSLPLFVAILSLITPTASLSSWSKLLTVPPAEVREVFEPLISTAVEEDNSIVFLDDASDSATVLFGLIPMKQN